MRIKGFSCVLLHFFFISYSPFLVLIAKWLSLRVQTKVRWSDVVKHRKKNSRRLCDVWHKFSKDEILSYLESSLSDDWNSFYVKWKILNKAWGKRRRRRRRKQYFLDFFSLSFPVLIQFHEYVEKLNEKFRRKNRHRQHQILNLSPLKC